MSWYWEASERVREMLDIECNTRVTGWEKTPSGECQSLDYQKAHLIDLIQAVIDDEHTTSLDKMHLRQKLRKLEA